MEQDKSEFVVVSEKEESLKGFNPQGMHPGVMNGRRVYPKIDTSEPYKSGKGKLGKHQQKLTNRRNAHAHTLKNIPSNVNPASFKTPGSMKQHAN